jgi:glutamyl-tRNA synthetase
MHLGNAFAALLAWLDVRSLGGEMLLRMEDLDPQRCKPEYTLQLAEDLRWLGLDWDTGWREGDPTYAQSHRTAYYQEAFRRLAEARLVYPCYCSRKELLAASAPHASDGLRVYSGRCRGLSSAERDKLAAGGRAPAWRAQVPDRDIAFTDGNFGPQRENLARDCGDFILRRSDGVYAYQLAVAEDDGRMGVTRVVRGWDLLSSTPRQIWLLGQLGYEAPTYCHLPLLVTPEGRRLAKRDRDLDLGTLRRHTTPETLIGILAHAAGLIDRPEPVSAHDLIPVFSWDKVGRADRVITGLESLGL